MAHNRFRRKFVWLGLAVFSVACVWYLRVPLSVAQIILRMPLNGPNTLVDEIYPSMQEYRKYRLSTAVADKNGRIHVLGSKKGIVHVLSVDADGKNLRVVPLRRSNGVLMRQPRNMFSVSADGRFWWTADIAIDDRPGVPKGRILLPGSLITVHDSTGRAVQEWRVGGIAVGSLSGVANGRLYIADYDKKLIWVFKMGQAKPLQYRAPVNGLYINHEGIMWRNWLDCNSHRRCVISCVGLDGKTTPFFKFQMLDPKTQGGYVPFIKSNLGAIIQYEGDTKLLTKSGQLLPLTTQPALQGDGLRVGLSTFLNVEADGTYWMDTGFAKDKNSPMQEYQIVKVSPPRPRWQVWLNALRGAK